MSGAVKDEEGARELVRATVAEWNSLTPSERARRVRKKNRLQGLEERRARNRAQNVKDKEAAYLRRRAESFPGTDRAPALARAFRRLKTPKYGRLVLGKASP